MMLMDRERLAELNRLEITRLCHSGLDSRTLRREILQLLQVIVPFDYAYFSTTDPATHLGTSSVLAEEPPSWCMSVFLENEFLQQDFNQFSDMARRRQAVSILSEAARSELHRSHRFREMLNPLAMEDELRAIFVTDDACWGTLCLHRGTASYTPEEAAHLAQLTDTIADGLRKALLLSRVPLATTLDSPGLLILSDDLSVIAMTAPAQYWLSELSAMEKADGGVLPVSVRSVVAGLKALESGRLAVNVTPKVRLYMRSGHWLVLYASRLISSASQTQVSVIFELAQPAEIAPVIMQAYALTRREGEITQCVVKGWSTTEIAARLHISPNTVQDHLKAIFEKVAVGSRGELAARIFVQQHRSD
ncbi:MAG: helix-turn-helix transcriptional regulator [Anaerolineae bacterium]|nr:helix-turn-helix transcriptional regulator [Anaerolineae bacterium]